MRKTIYLFFLSFFWGCLQEDSPPEVLSPGEKQLGNLALFFSQKLDRRLLDHAGELESVSGTLTPLVQHARVGYNAFYGGHYFIIPLQNKQGQIEAGLVYPLKGNDTISGFNLSGDLDTPSVLDERTLGAVSNNGQRFLLSNKFLAWKKEGLSVAPGLYAYSESLDGKHVYRPNPNAPRSKVDGEYLQADVIINFEIDPNTEIFIVEPGPAITVTILTESDIHDLFLDALGAFAGVNGINQVQLTGAGFGNAYLLLEVANEDAIMNGVNLYIGAVQELFDTRYDVSDIPFYYSYYLGDNNSSSPGDGGDQDWGGTGEGGGTAGGGTSTPPGTGNLSASGIVNRLFRNSIGDDISLLVGVIDSLMNECAYRAVLNYLLTGNSFEVIYDPNLGDGTLYGGASASATSTKLKFRDSTSIKTKAISEELYHMYQYRYLNTNSLDSIRHLVEFEAHLFRDIAAYVKHGGDDVAAEQDDHRWACLNLTSSDDEREEYFAFLDSLTSDGTGYNGTTISEEDSEELVSCI